MTAAGACFPAADSPRVFGAAPGEAFASWDPDTSSWREDELATKDPASTGGGRAPEFSGGWSTYGLTRRGSALVLATPAHEVAGRGPRSWPTPKVTTNRSHRRSIIGDGHWSPPGLEQAAELSEGILPREVGSVAGIKSPAARALLPGDAPRRSWGTPRASSGMTSRLRDPAKIQTADGRLEDQVALAEGRAGGWLNPEWVEWLMGFPADWTGRSARVEPETGPGLGPDGLGMVTCRDLPATARVAHLPARHGARPPARRSVTPTRPDPRLGAGCGTGEKLRSPRHPEVGS